MSSEKIFAIGIKKLSESRIARIEAECAQHDDPAKIDIALLLNEVLRLKARMNTISAMMADEGGNVYEAA